MSDLEYIAKLKNELADWYDRHKELEAERDRLLGWNKLLTERDADKEIHDLSMQLTMERGLRKWADTYGNIGGGVTAEMLREAADRLARQREDLIKFRVTQRVGADVRKPRWMPELVWKWMWRQVIVTETPMSFGPRQNGCPRHIYWSGIPEDCRECALKIGNQ